MTWASDLIQQFQLQSEHVRTSELILICPVAVALLAIVNLRNDEVITIKRRIQRDIDLAEAGLQRPSMELFSLCRPAIGPGATIIRG